MKEKKFTKKLELNKLTIASLELENARGGWDETELQGCPSCPPCIKTDYTVCRTIELTCTLLC
jgi:hypothetical protein